MKSTPLPRYAELLTRQDAPAGAAWGHLTDHLGTAGLLGAESALRAARLVRTGRHFGLDYPVNAFDPPTVKARSAARHVVFAAHDYSRDDYLDSFYTQSSSHVDGLRHQRHDSGYFFAGRSAADVDTSQDGLGVDQWARDGLVGRGVLLDVGRYLSRRGQTLDHRAGEPFSVDLLDAVADEQGVRFEFGDMLFIRTGWCEFYFETMTDADRRTLRDSVRCPGLEQSRRSLEWMWDSHFSVVGSDTIALEARPSVPTSPFTSAVKTMMHPEMIALLGLCLAELLHLGDLAADCDQDRVYEFMAICKPLHLIDGVGAPANIVAIK